MRTRRRAASPRSVRTTGRTIQVNWTPAEAVPTAEPVSGYSIDAIGPAVNGVQNVIGARTGTSATRVTLTVDPAVTDYTVEVRSIAGAKMGEPFAAVSAPTPPDGDLNPPTVVADPAPDATDPSVPVEAPNGVTLKTDPAGDGDIYYTTDGSSAILGDLPSDTAQLYVPGTVIPVTEAGTEIHWAAFDAAGNSSSGFGTYSPSSTPLPAPDAPALTGTAGQGEVTLRWNAVDRADGYQITVYNADGTKAADNVQPAATSDLTQRVTGLTPETAYDFTVKARNSQGLFGAESEKLRLTVQKITDQVFITRARYKAGDEFRVEGTSTATSGTVNIYAVNNGVRSTTPITGMSNVTLTPAVAPATGTTFSARLRNGNVPARPQQIVAISSNGGVSPAFTVTNG